jgi:lipoprotein-releasing system permease protein
MSFKRKVKTMRYELLIALKHLMSPKRQALSLVSTLAISGVCLGVAALIGGFSITAGFETAFKDKLLGVTSHIFARPYRQINVSAPEFETELKRNLGAEIKGVAATTYHKTIFSGPKSTTGGFIKGIYPEEVPKVLKLNEYIESGSLDALRLNQIQIDELNVENQVFPIVLGAQLADKLGVKVGGMISALSAFSEQSLGAWKGVASSPTAFNFRVVGIFRAGYDEYDSRFSYVHFDTIEKIFGKKDLVTGYEIALQDPMKAQELVSKVDYSLKFTVGDAIDWSFAIIDDPKRALKISRDAYEDFYVQDWYAQNPNLYASLMYQRIAILIVLSVMLILASCNVASMLIMMVLERTKDIAILKAMGAKAKEIQLIFVLEGLGIAIIGSVFGAFLGYAFCAWLLGAGVSLDPKVYGIDHFPVEFHWLDYLYSMLGGWVIIGLATYFPAKRGGQLDAAEGLRMDYME